MITFARELQHEHSRQIEIMQKALSKAEKAGDEAERSLQGVQDFIKQDALRHKKLRHMKFVLLLNIKLRAKPTS